MSDNKQENDNHEAVADILAEMRGMGNYQRYSGDHAHALADRIEAAWKRERAKVEADALTVGGIVEATRTAEKSSAVGNAAAMREALVEVKERIVNATTRRDWSMDDAHLVCNIIEDALSAPARNCDKFADAETARQAWLDDADNWDEFGSPKLELHEWLLAKSTERKGVIHE